MKKIYSLILFVCTLSLLSTADLYAQNTFTIGYGTSSNGSQDYPAPYGQYYTGARHVFIYRKQELIDSGWTTARQISQVGFNVTALNAAGPHQGFTIKMKFDPVGSLTSFPSGMTTVYTSPSEMPVMGWNMKSLIAPMVWDPSKGNIIVEVCFSNGTYSYTENASTEMTTGLPSGSAYANWSDDPGNGCADNGGNELNSTGDRPNIRFVTQPNAPMVYDSSWAEAIDEFSNAGKSNQKILKFVVSTTGMLSPLSMTDLTFNTGASTDPTGDIATAKVYYTGMSGEFSTANLVGTVTGPNGLHTITSTKQLLPGLNNFWLVYDVKPTATEGNALDAEITGITVGGTPEIPKVTSPDGVIRIGRIYDFEASNDQGFIGVNEGSTVPNEWQRGVPQKGPTSALSGVNCWGTNLVTDFSQLANYSLETPPMLVTDTIVNISFSQWFNFVYTYNDVYADVDVQVNNGGWSNLYTIDNGSYWNSNDDWQRIKSGMATNIGDTIKFRWHFQTYTGAPGAGWFIDDLGISGVNDLPQYYASSKVTQIEGACDANRRNLAVLKIEIDAPGNLNPLYIKDLDFNTNGSTSGIIQSAKLFYTGTTDKFDSTDQFGSAVTAPSGLFTFSDSTTLSSGKNYFWLTYNLNSSASLNDKVDAECSQLMISLVSYIPDNSAPSGLRFVGRGYNFDTTTSQGFAGIEMPGSVIPNEWQRGTPVSGPLAAASGTTCWATNLTTGAFSQSADYYLQTPAYIATDTAAFITYDNWFNMGQIFNDVNATLEYRINSGSWDFITGIDNSSMYRSIGWEEVRTYGLTSIGDTVQFRWHFNSQSYSQPASGWYIDNVSIAGISEMQQVYKSAASFQSYQPVTANAQDIQIMRVEVEMEGTVSPLNATLLEFNTAGSVAGIISGAKLYATGNVGTFSNADMVGTAVTAPSGAFSFSEPVQLFPGTNYFWLTYSLNGTGHANDSVDASFTNIVINAIPYTPNITSPEENSVIGVLYNFDTTSNQGFVAVIDPLAGTGTTLFERGAPTNGPAAYSGTKCWATDLDEFYQRASNTTLTSEAFVVSTGVVNFGFKQWYNFGRTFNAVTGNFDYRVNGGSWNTVYNVDISTFSNSKDLWQDVAGDVSASAGDTIEFRWNFIVGNGFRLAIAEGWYIDNFIVSGIDPLTQSYGSSTAIQNVIPTAAGKRNQQVLKVQLEMLGGKDPLTVDGFGFNTTGSSLSPTLITDAKLFYTGSTDKFDTTNQYGSTVAAPSGTFTFTGTKQLEAGNNFFWLTYSVDAGALLTDSIDAEFTSIIVDGVTQTPVETAPTGNKAIGILYDFEATDNQGFFTQSYTVNPSEWQRGTPSNSSILPNAAFSGTKVWKTKLNGAYSTDGDYGLFSPVYVATSDHVDLTFMEALSLPTCCDGLEIDYQINNTGYNFIISYNRSSGRWETRDNISIPTNIGDTIQFQWRFFADGTNDAYDGWMIDDVIISGVEEVQMSFVSANVYQDEGSTAAGFNLQTILGVDVVTSGSKTQLSSDYFKFNTTGTTDAADIVSAKLYYTGSSKNLSTTSLFGTAVAAPNGSFVFTGNQPLMPGDNFFWLVYDIADSAVLGNLIDAGIDSVGLGGTLYEPSDIAPVGARTISLGYTFEASTNQGFKTEILTGAVQQWQRGTPSPSVIGGPAAAFDGAKCWGTNLTGVYELQSAYSLISPTFVANSSDIEIAYKEFYDTYDPNCGSSADLIVDVNVNNGGWNQWFSSNGYTGWQDVRFTISNSPGDTIAIRWTLASYNYCNAQPGWYIDNMIFSDVTEIDMDAPEISYAPIANTATLVNRTLTNFAQIVDPFSGVDSTTFAPRIYYKKSSEMDVFGANNSTVDGWKYVTASNLHSPFSFTINYSLLNTPLAVGDVIQYFVVAQDLSAAAHVSASPADGFIGTSVDAVTSAPSLPNEYTITLLPLSGTYNVGTGQVYTTLTAATNDLNKRGMSGAVTFALTDNNYSSAETFPIVVGNVTGASAVNTVIIKPTIAGTVISGSNSDGIFKFDNASYTMLNGAVSGTSKDLTVENTNTASGSAIWFSSNGVTGCQYDTVKNTLIKAGTSSNGTMGIAVGGISLGSSGSGHDHIAIINNSIYKAYTAIYINGSASNNAANTSIINNIIGSSVSTERIKYSGIEMERANGANIKGNTLFNFFDNTNGGGFVIRVGLGSSNVNIENNRIDSMTTPLQNTGHIGIALMTEQAGSNITVVNNFISRIYSKNDVMGIYMGYMTGNVKLYHNTVNIAGSYAGSTYSTRSTALLMDGYNANADIRNNIFSNSYINTSSATSVSYALQTSNTPSFYSFMDYNNYRVDGSQGILASVNYNNKTTLASLRSATTKDVNSTNDSVFFVSGGDLHLAGTSIGNVNLKATPLAAVPLDIDGQTRSTIAPYKGADENAVPLPVKLSSFIASRSEAAAILRWTTASEINNSHFVIERSVDMRDFEAIGQVKGKGNSNVTTAYTFIDKAAAQVANKGIVYYRLRQVDFNGASDVSDAKAVNFGTSVASAFTIYPNPFVQSLNFNVTSEENAVMNITISDLQGRTVMSREVMVPVGTNVVTFNEAASLSQGIYIIRTDLNGVMNTSKLIKMDQ